MKGKHILITGASKGIGKAITEHCLKAGAICHQVSRSHGYDLTSDIDKIIEQMPQLDGVVHCAGISSIEPFKYYDESIFELNYIAGAKLLQGLISKRKIKKEASIVLISSIAGTKCTFIGGAAYAASKAALTSMGKTMSVELGAYGIRVNSVCPGIIKTEITDYYDNDFSKMSIKRYGEVDDVAPMVVFLLSDQSKYITGSEIVIDGGYTTR